jgi:predicted permease
VQVQLTESWLLAVGGAALGLLIAVVLKQVLQGLMFPAPPGFSFTVPLDLRVLALTLGIATATGLLAGIAPAWMASRAQLGAALGRTASRSVARAPRLRSALASLQLAMSLTLLIGALLLVTTVWNLRAVDLGFSPKAVTSITLDLDGYQDNRDVQFLKAFDERANADARFQGAAVATLTPFSSTYMTRILPAGAAPAAAIRVAANGVSDRYFDVLRTPLVRGRAFTAAEAFATESTDPMPIIVDEPLARQLFGTVDVIGRTVRFPKVGSRPERDLPIIGVARASLWADLVRTPEPFVYMPYGRFDAKRLSPRLIVRSSHPVPEIASAVTAISRQLDAAVALSPPWPLESALDREMSQQRLFAWSLTILGGLGFVLAALGVYGLVAQASADRTREFGIRVAIGAGRGHIAGLVIRFAATIAAAGTIGGVALAYFGSRALASMLFGITAVDPRIYLAAVSALAIVVLAACAIPALRAVRVQPIDVLRTE